MEDERSPLSKSAINRLGQRLAKAQTPDDLALLWQVQERYAEALNKAVTHIRGCIPAIHAALRTVPRIQLSSRVKTLNTLLDKLRGGSSLPRIQDVAGCRLVGHFTLSEQDTISSIISEGMASKVTDRRRDPSHGYRALHVVLTIDELPIEVQIRTIHQHFWANVTEGLADEWGRGIRYGFPPEGDDPMIIAQRRAVIRWWLSVSNRFWDTECAVDELDMATRHAPEPQGTAHVRRLRLKAKREAEKVRLAINACPSDMAPIMWRTWNSMEQD